MPSFRGAARRRSRNRYPPNPGPWIPRALASLGPGMTAAVTSPTRATAPRPRPARSAARPRQTPEAGCGTRSPAAWCIGACRASASAAACVSVISPLRWRMSHGTPCAFMAGNSGSRRRAASARTSSSAPAAIMASKRASMRRKSSSRSGMRKIFAARETSRIAGVLVVLPFLERTAGRQHHFERARDARAVAGRQPRRRRGIAPAKLRVKRGGAVASEPRAHLRADARRDRRHGGEPAGERTEVEAGAADDDGGARVASRRGERRGGLPAPAADGIVFRRVDMAVEPVRRSLSSAAVGRAVMMRRSRYTCMELALMIVPPYRSASASASADLPLAVGPAMRMMLGLLTGLT